MNTKYLGDSYDLVKRFFSRELTNIGYEVVADPMFTGPWADADKSRLLNLVQVSPERKNVVGRTALFLDPDTGIHERQSRHHVSYARIAGETESYQLVFSFDQSFSRREAPITVIRRKIEAMRALGCSAMYYDSHARFLFASRVDAVMELREHLLSVGLPGSRLVGAGT
ncbi:MAG TPA: hypothetical protein VGJ82_09980 [Thermoanaerobaculia bacterium]